MFISEEIGGRKPEPEYFQRCFERIPDFAKRIPPYWATAFRPICRAAKTPE